MRRTPTGFYALDVHDVLVIGEEVTGTEVKIRDQGLLLSALARPFASAFGADAYPTVWQKAAALLHSIARNHALVNGNKRTAWGCTVVFGLANEVNIQPGDQSSIVDLVLEAAQDLRAVDEITDVLASWAAPMPHGLQ